jgi:hypothetical protein
LHIFEGYFCLCHKLFAEFGGSVVIILKQEGNKKFSPFCSATHRYRIDVLLLLQ